MARTHEDDFVRLTNRVQAPYKTSEVMSSISSESRATASISFGTMRHLVVALITVYALSFSSVLAEEAYTSKFDNVDVDAIINNERLLNGYVGCLLDKSPCTPDAGELKSKYVERRDVRSPWPFNPLTITLETYVYSENIFSAN